MEDENYRDDFYFKCEFVVYLVCLSSICDKDSKAFLVHSRTY